MDEKTRELFEKAQGGSEEALEELTLNNVKMIQKIANRFKRTYHDKEDFFQIACIGFIRAVQKFDISRGNQFSTYAYPVILNELYKFVRNEGTVRTPRAYQEVDRLMKKHDCFGKSPEEIAKIIGVENIDIIKETLLYLHNGHVLSLNGVSFGSNDGSEDITLGEMVVGDDSSSFWDDNLALKEAVEQLDEREQNILNMRYKKEMSQREVAEVYGVSQAQISRLEIRALSKVRVFMGLPAQLPKQEKKAAQPKKTVGIKGNPEGDRVEAIRLLKTSTLSYPDIAKITGVPLGSMYRLGRENRPKEIQDMIKKRPTQQRGELNVYEA